MNALKRHLTAFGLALALPLLAGCLPKPEAKPEVLLSKPIQLDIPDQEVVLEFEASPENIENFQSYIIAIEIEIDNSTKNPNPFNSQQTPPALFVKAEKIVNGQWQIIDLPDEYVSRSRFPESKKQFFAKLPAWHSQEVFFSHPSLYSVGTSEIRTILGRFTEGEWIKDGQYRLSGHYRVTIRTTQSRPDFEGMTARAIIRQAYFSGK